MNKDNNAVVVYPAYNGNGLTGAVASRIVEVFADYTKAIIPLVNGPDEKQLQEVAWSAIPGLVPLVIKPEALQGRGLVGALVTGIECVYAMYPDCAIVRKDPDHNPIEALTLLLLAQEYPTRMVGGNRVYEGRRDLMPSEYDYETHERYFPEELYGKATNGRVRVGCAHGYFALGRGLPIKEILSFIKNLIEKVESNLGGRMAWGFDASVYLAVDLLQRQGRATLQVIDFPAMTERIRPDAKVTQQRINHKCLTDIFTSEFGSE